MPLLRRSLDACLLHWATSPLSHEAHTDPRVQALEMNQERADLAVVAAEERLRCVVSHYTPDAAMTERLCCAFLGPIFATHGSAVTPCQVLRALKRRGVKTAIVSNTPWAALGRLALGAARYGLLDAVDAVVFCTDVGWRTPHPTPFDALSDTGRPDKRGGVRGR